MASTNKCLAESNKSRTGGKRPRSGPEEEGFYLRPPSVHFRTVLERAMKKIPNLLAKPAAHPGALPLISTQELTQ
jgi:hypothetical protein